MFLMYGLLLVAMIFGVVMLLKGKRNNSAMVQRRNKTHIPNAANSNDGGNSQRADNNGKGSEGQSDYGMDSMGADNDEDKLSSQAGDPNLKRDFKAYKKKD